MARQPFHVPSTNDHRGAFLWDSDGGPILEMWASNYTVHEPDGTISTRKLSAAIELMCGTIWHPGMWDKVPVGLCQLCRNPPYTFPCREKPRHGIVSLSAARLCARCGALVCPRHVRAMDAESFCLPCFPSQRTVGFIRRIFYEPEHE